MNDLQPVIEARQLSIEYRIGKQWLNAICEVNLAIQPRQIHGLVGESGSGKSTLGLGLMRYLNDNARINTGEIWFDGQDLVQASHDRLRQIWGRHINLVPQNPLDSLNPSLPIGAQMTELTRLQLGHSRQQAIEAAVEALQSVRIADPEQVLKRYPHQLSGGMQQRVMIAMALATRPRLLVLDEPTTSLDVTTQAVILDLVRDLIHEEQAAALYVSHDLGTVAQLCDHVTVLYAGEVVESAAVHDVFARPLHPYTIGLLGSIPGYTAEKNTRLSTIEGVAPDLAGRANACGFAGRCPIAIERCHREKPALETISETQSVRCWRWQEIQSSTVNVRNQPQGIFETVEASTAGNVLSAAGLNKRFGEVSFMDWLLGQRDIHVQAVEDVSLHVPAGTTVGIVGESGSGKTTLARIIVALTTAESGSLQLLDHPISLRLAERGPEVLRDLRLIFQNPNDALNPYHTIGQAIGRTFQMLKHGQANPQEIQTRVAEVLAAVGLPESYAARFPQQLSGGEKQRVAIARAFVAQPALIIADEPTSSLDVSVQATILNLLKDLRAEYGASYIFISHALDVINYLADWIIVMYLGEILEQGPADTVYGLPMHPYTEALLSAIPQPDPSARPGVIRLEGDIPSPRSKPSGCAFHTRCPRFLGTVCAEQVPPLQHTSDGHQIRCHIPMDELRIMQAEKRGE